MRSLTSCPPASFVILRAGLRGAFLIMEFWPKNRSLTAGIATNTVMKRCRTTNIPHGLTGNNMFGDPVPVVFPNPASFSIPRPGPGPDFEDVVFLELQPPQAEAIVAEMNSKVRYFLSTVDSDPISPSSINRVRLGHAKVWRTLSSPLRSPPITTGLLCLVFAQGGDTGSARLKGRCRPHAAATRRRSEWVIPTCCRNNNLTLQQLTQLRLFSCLSTGY